jgi:hypothetical protein
MPARAAACISSLPTPMCWRRYPRPSAIVSGHTITAMVMITPHIGNSSLSPNVVRVISAAAAPMVASNSTRAAR